MVVEQNGDDVPGQRDELINDAVVIETVELAKTSILDTFCGAFASISEEWRGA